MTTEVTTSADTWSDLVQGELNVLKATKATDRSELPTLSNGVTWQALLAHLYDSGMYFGGGSSSSSTKPYEGMQFRISVCRTGDGMPYQFSPAKDLPAPAADREGCFESVVFPMNAPADGILLVHQSHAPCTICIRAYRAWATERELPILVLSDNGKGDIGKDCTAIFIPRAAILLPDDEEKGKEKGSGKSASGAMFIVMDKKTATKIPAPAKAASKPAVVDSPATPSTPSTSSSAPTMSGSAPAQATAPTAAMMPGAGDLNEVSHR